MDKPDELPLLLGPRGEAPITYAGVTYTVSKLGIHQLVELERWMRRVAFVIFRDMMEENVIPAAWYSQSLAEAWDRSNAMMLFSRLGSSWWIDSIEGRLRTLWVSVRMKHAKVTIDDIERWVPVEAVYDLGGLVSEIISLRKTNPTVPPSNTGETSQSTDAS